MSFLDNLENNLKALESREQGGLEDQRSRDADRSRAKAAAPWAEKLKRDTWTQSLMQQSTRAGFQRRIKVNLIWIDTTLRLEALDQRLEFRPEPNGIMVVALNEGNAVSAGLIDMTEDPQTLIAPWIAIVEEQKKRDDATRRALAEQLAAEEAALEDAQ